MHMAMSLDVVTFTGHAWELIFAVQPSYSWCLNFFFNFIWSLLLFTIIRHLISGINGINCIDSKWIEIINK